MSVSAGARDVRRGVASLVALHGVVVIAANARSDPFASEFTRRWVLFGGESGFPGDFGRNVFAGTIGLGVLLVAFAAAIRFSAGRPAARTLATAAGVFALVLVFGYRADGNLLGAKPSAAAVILAAALALAATSPTRTTGGTGTAG